MFGFSLIAVGESCCKLDVLLVNVFTFPPKVGFSNSIILFLVLGNCCLPLCVLCDFFFCSPHCFHLYFCFIKYHRLRRYMGGGVLVYGDGGGIGACI